MPPLVSVIALAPALNVVAPAPADSMIAPLCVIAPAAVTPSVPEPTLDAASCRAALFCSVTLLAPLLLSDTPPVKLLPASVNVIVWAPALNVAAPAPAC
ncbi:MAG: hypothetical protein WDO24_06745 [Pseudomonadota bacterium]